MGRGSGWWGGVRVDVIEELKFLGKFTKKKIGGGGSGWVGGGSGVGLVGWGQGGCERRIEVFVKVQKRNLGGGWVGGGGGWVRGGVGLVGGGVRVYVNEELKFFVKIQKKKKNYLGGGARGGGGGVRWGGRVGGVDGLGWM